jgi:hypothetical protein
VAGVFLSVLQRPKALAQGPVAAQLAAEAAKQKPSQTPPASAIRLSQDLTLMVVEWCGVGGVGEGRPMDKRRSYYLHSKQDDFAEPAADESRLDLDDIPFIIPANDNVRTKDALSARRGSLLRRLLALHNLRRPD